MNLICGMKIGYINLYSLILKLYISETVIAKVDSAVEGWELDFSRSHKSKLSILGG